MHYNIHICGDSDNLYVCVDSHGHKYLKNDGNVSLGCTHRFKSLGLACEAIRLYKGSKDKITVNGDKVEFDVDRIKVGCQYVDNHVVLRIAKEIEAGRRDKINKDVHY